jgi:hypothetical protein
MTSLIPKPAIFTGLWQEEKFQGQDFVNTVTPIPMGPAMKSSFPEVEAMCRVYQMNTLCENW